MMHKSYADTDFGQVHLRKLAAASDETKPALICLHPAPSSGLYFTTAMPLLNNGRRVIAPDYPGYGGSDTPSDEASIAVYAKAMLQAIDEDDPVDILGFHTGCLVAVEMALRAPTSIRRLVLCDIPFFTGEAQQQLARKMSIPMPIGPELESIAGPWTFNIESRIADVPLPRAIELFAEHMRVGTNDARGFVAAFAYDCAANFAKLDADTIVLATQSGLHAPSAEAAGKISGARFVDVTEVSSAVFESGATAICARINTALDT